MNGTLHFASLHCPDLILSNAEMIPPLGAESSQTRCGGNGFEIQFRDASPPPSAWAPSFDGEWWLLEPSQQLYWSAEADDCSDDRRSIGLNSAEASKLLLIWRGTGSSNPVPSSRQSVSLRISPPSQERREFSAMWRPCGAAASAETRKAQQRRSEQRWCLCRAIFQYRSAAGAVRDIGGAGREQSRLPREQ